MRKISRILAIIMTAVLLVTPCMAGQSMQTVYADEIENDLPEEGFVEEDDSKEADDSWKEGDSEEIKNFQETETLEESGEDLGEETEDTSHENDSINYEPEAKAEAEVFGSRTQETVVNLYYIEDAYKDKISLPSEYRSTYQIVLPDGVSGNVQYGVSGGSAEVNNNGIVSPKIKIYYKNEAGGYWTTEYIEGAPTRNEYSSGQSTITVICGNYKQVITVNVNSYTEIYVDDMLDKIYREITSGKTMTETELARAFTQYAAEQYSYSASYSSYYGLIVNGAGDCWANTSFINALCEKAGIEARTRYAANDSGAGSGHRNSIIRADGKYYVADAGFTGNAPRPYDFYEEPEGLYLMGETLAQYDAFETEAVIPEIVGGKEIKVIRNRNYANGNEQSVFAYGVDVTSVSLPKTVTDISTLAFQGCTALAQISVDKDNPNYMSIGGILYTKGGDKVVRVPQAMKEVKLPDGVTAIEDYAFSQSQASEVTIPDGVTTIGLAAFWRSSIEVITVPDSVTAIGEGAFETDTRVTIKGTRGSYAEQYAKEKGLTFIDVKSGDINADGKVTMPDLLMCLHHVSGRTTLTGDAFLAADVSGDGKVTMVDLMRILHYVSGRNQEL